MGFNHLNVRSPDFKRTVDFLREALGMAVTPVPGHESNEKAVWVYDANGSPILHMASSDIPYSATEVLPDNPPRGSGAIHHVAFTCTDYDGMRARLIELGVEIRENHDATTGVRQIFVRDPSDINFELNFAGD